MKDTDRKLEIMDTIPITSRKFLLQTDLIPVCYQDHKLTDMLRQI